jgi:hypothetical protein
MSTLPGHSHLNVFTVEEFEANGEKKSRWLKVGVAFPHKDGNGLNIELQAFPRDGRLVVLPPKNDDADAGS